MIARIREICASGILLVISGLVGSSKKYKINIIRMHCTRKRRPVFVYINARRNAAVGKSSTDWRVFVILSVEIKISSKNYGILYSVGQLKYLIPSLFPAGYGLVVIARHEMRTEKAVS